MDYSFAPMEGFTGVTYRKLHHRYFPGVDRYYTPFISTNQHYSLSKQDRKELDPDQHPGFLLVPQILTKYADQFLYITEELISCGYSEMNLNLGCPSGTVVPKGKGAGMLKDPEHLRSFFFQVFEGLPSEEMKVSVKTRVGVTDPDECHRLMEIFNDFPLSELIIHARTLKDFYGGSIRTDAFASMYRSSRCPVSYNGDILSVRDCLELKKKYPSLLAVMIGRGLLINPALVRSAKGGRALEKDEYLSFLEELFEEYAAEFSSEKNAMSRMKDLWKYVCQAFEENQEALRSIQKSSGGNEYRGAVRRFFRDTELKRQPASLEGSDPLR